MGNAMGHEDVSFLRNVPGVVHVGANSGQERDLYRNLGLAVVWVEPIAEVFDELVRNITDYPKQKAYRELLADRDGVEYEFHVANNSGGHPSFNSGSIATSGPRWTS